MTTTLVACVLLPRLLVQLATTHLAVRSPVSVLASDTADAPVLDCCPRAAAQGVHPGLPAFVAQQRCPSLNLVTLASSITETARLTVAAVLRTCGEDVLPCSQQGWLPTLHALGAEYRHAQREAMHIQEGIAAATGLWSVVGLASQRMVAQLAAQQASARQDGAPVVILPGEESTFLAPLPLTWLPGVGARTEAQLQRLGIMTIGQFAALPPATVVHVLGRRGVLLHQQACGLDVAPASFMADATHQPLASSWTYAPHPCAETSVLVRHTQRLTERVGRRLRAQAQAAGTLTVAIRWADGRQQQRSERFRCRVDLDRELAQGSHAALNWLLQQRRLAVHELRIRLGDFGPRQAGLFDTDPRLTQRQHALDQIKQRHGTSAILLAWLLPPPTV